MSKQLQQLLELRDNHSDKVYNIYLQPSTVRLGSWLLIAKYGKRYGYLTTSIKTPRGIEYNTGVDMFHKLLNEKLKKGYNTAE